MTIYPGTETTLQVLDFYTAYITGTHLKGNTNVEYKYSKVKGSKISRGKTTRLKPLPNTYLTLHRLSIKSIGYTAKVEFEYSADITRKGISKRYTFIHKTTIERNARSGKPLKVRDFVEKFLNPTIVPTNDTTLKIALKFFKYCFTNQFDKFATLLSPTVTQKWVRIGGGFEEGDTVSSGSETADNYKTKFFDVSKNFDIHDIAFKLNGPHAFVTCDVDEDKIDENKRYNMANSYQLSLNDTGKIERILVRTTKDEISQ